MAGTHQEVMPRGTTLGKTSRTSPCRGIRTPSFSSPVSKGSSQRIDFIGHPQVGPRGCLITCRLSSEFYDVEQRTTLLQSCMHALRWRKSSVPPTQTATPSRWRSGSWRRSSLQQQSHRWIRTFSPLAVMVRAIARGGGDLVVLDSSSLSSSSDKLLVPDSSTSGNRTKAWDNSSSAGVEVGTTSNLPDSSSSMRGLIGLKALDEGGLSRNLLHH